MQGKGQEKSAKIEDVLEDLGGYGKFQRIFTCLSIYPELAAAMIILSPVFTGSDKVPIFCDKNQTNFQDSFTCDINCTEDGSNSVVFSSIVQEWHLVCSRSWIVEMITSCQMAGMMSGAMISSLIADRFGRNTAGYFFARCGMGILGLLPAFANGSIMYAVARFFAGFGMGGCFVVGMVHFMEFLTPKWRTMCGCVSLWPLGEMLLALVAYLIPNWRYLTVATAVPTFLVLLLFPFILESPRWLLTRKRTKDAYQVFEKIAKINGKPMPEYSEIEAVQMTVLKEEACVLRGFDGVRKIVTDSSLCVPLAILTWANSTNSLVYYAVSFSAKSLSGSPYLNMFFMGIEDLVAIPATLAFNNRLGRKKTYLLYTVLASISMGVALIMTAKHELADAYPSVITVSAHIGRFSITASWGALNCLTMESFPTAVRTTCLGFTAFVGYMAAVVAPQVLLLSKISPSIPYFLYCSLTVTSCIITSFLKEMAGVPLKDVVRTEDEIDVAKRPEGYTN